MSDLMDSLRQRVDETRTTLEKAKQATVTAKTREDSLGNDLVAYERALDAEVRRSGGSGQEVAMREQEEASRRATEAILSDAPVNKTEFVGNLIRSRLDGMTPPEIFREFNRLEIPVHRNYIYAVLARLVDREAIRERNGRYVAVESSARPEGRVVRMA